jgi:hypothetical protein
MVTVELMSMNTGIPTDVIWKLVASPLRRTSTVARRRTLRVTFSDESDVAVTL